MQVALVCNSAFGTDGISMFVLNNHRCFKHEGARYHLIYSSTHSPEDVVDGYVKEFKRSGDKASFIPKGDGLMLYARKLYLYLKTEKIDVLHVHGSSSAILIEMVVAKLAGVKRIVTHCHSTGSSHNWVHKILRPTVNLLTNERLACGELAGKWMYGKHRKYIIVPNCIDTAQYAFDETVRKKMRKDLGIDENTLVIGHVGMFTEVKNQTFLIYLIDTLKQRRKRNCKLLLIGHGLFMEAVKKESMQLGLSNDVIFLGNRNDVPHILMAMDVFCLPSLYEGFPIVSIEAQAAGLPALLSSNISKEVCVTDLVKLLPIDNGVEEWVQNIEKVSLKPHERRAYAQKIKDAGYDIRFSASMLEKIYEKVLVG